MLSIYDLKLSLEAKGRTVGGYALIDLYNALPDKPDNICLYEINIKIEEISEGNYGTILPFALPSIFIGR